MVMFSIDLEQSDMDELCAVGEGMERFGPEADLAKQHRRYCQVECPAHPAQAGKLFATAGLQSVSSGEGEKRKFQQAEVTRTCSARQRTSSGRLAKVAAAMVSIPVLSMMPGESCVCWLPISIADAAKGGINAPWCQL